MSPLNPPLSKDDLNNACWQNVVNSSERKDCFFYESAFREKYQEAKKAGNLRDQEVFAILAAVTSDAIEPESTEEFSADILKYLTDEQLDFLAEIAPEISDPELQARVADILWVAKKDYRMTQLAIPAYLESAKILESPDQRTYFLDRQNQLTNCFIRIERALQLACEINCQNNKQLVLNRIEEVLDHFQGKDLLGLSTSLMELLQKNRLGDPAKYATLSEKAANLAETHFEWLRARELWHIKAKWEKDSTKKVAASMSAAETYVKEAKSALEGTPRAAHLLIDAVKAFRNIEDSDDKARAEEVHKLLLQYQKKIPKVMMTIFQEVDISEFVVKGKNFQEALFSLARLVTPTDISQLRQQVQQQARDSVLSDLFSTDMVNEMGKFVDRQPGSILSSNPKEAEAATHSEMCRQAIDDYKLKAQADIEPARYKINLEYNVELNDILAIVSHRPFVPPGREYLYAKGLYAGLTGDFLTSTHILIPQIENSVRDIMSQRGIITSGLDDRGIQNEHNLNSTLYRSEITSIFDKNTLFDLKCLLVERADSNLRNRMAHGLINDGGFMSGVMVYTWWLTLRLCCLFILIHQQ